ncbi:non-ribosomal peptide synthetase [Streptacidiphilus melanogenes]|uniref:non-ribosomal peptide synthetase n=1 Tax=Streptacidiphilus melanogenes TaxID=411235 RepID=UPI00069431CB|nr:non-ribosomal peptide synthetase [Streptacidiphilus melanogenes]
MTASPDTPLPLTAAQAEVWYDEQFATGPLGYAMGDYIDLRGPLDSDLLRRALGRLSVEAEGLRVRFTERDGVPGQFVAPAEDGPLPLVDLSHEVDPESAAEAWMLRDLDVPMKAVEPPLTRHALLRLGSEHHRLYVGMHHILCDGYSRDLIHPRLAAIYTHLAAGGDAAELAASAPPSFRLLLDAERAYLDSPRVAKDRAYWTARLTAGAVEPSSLSTREPSPGRTALRSTEVLAPTAAGRLRTAAQAAGATPAVLAAAAMAAYVQRMTGQDEPLLTLPVTARVGAVARGVPGMVANYLPLPVPVRRGATRDQVLRAAWVEVANALRHQRYRGEQIRRDLGLRTDDRRPFGPFVNVLDQDPVLEFGPCRGQVVNLSTGIVNDLILTVLNLGDGSLELHLDGNRDLYDAGELAAHAARFRAFLDAFASCPADTVVDRLDVALRDEPVGLLTGPAVDAAEADAADTLASVRATAARTPDAVAVVDGDLRLGYAELARRAEGVGARLRDAGCGPDTVVGVLTRPGAGYVAAILGVQAAGAAWLPLEVAAPSARNASLLRDAGARVLLVQDGLDAEGAAACAEAGAVLALPLELPSDAQAPYGRGPMDQDGPARAATEQDLAYVMFTSGSTGRPKGAMVHRAGMLNHLRAKVDDCELGAGEAVVANAPLTFDVHVWQLLAPLLVGGRTVVAAPETALDPDALFALAAAESAAVLEVVPSLLRAALDLWDARGAAPSLADLRLLMVTGEALPGDLCARWQARYPGVGMVNAYGPTECSDDVTHAFVTPADAVAGRVPIGRPVRGTRLYVLGDGLRPVPAGVPGELWVGGVGVGRGYVGDPARTASVFPADPFAGGGARMYRTGDRVVLRPDGQLEFVERRDFQVKVRGRRVELGEIEAAVRSVPGVLDAVVVAHGSGLAGYVAAAGGVDAALLRERVGAVLPGWMVPGVWVVLDALPLTANGKVDRKALPAPGAAGTPGPVRTAPTLVPALAPGPRADREETLCAVFAAVLGLSEVGADDDFFALGGDSIRAIEVVSAARRKGLVLSTRDVFTGRTARTLAQAARAADGSAGPRDGSVDPVGVLELTPIAARLREDTGSPTGTAAQFSQHIAVRVPADLDAGRLSSALQALIDHHDALRTRVTEPAPGLWQAEVMPRGAAPAEDGLVLAVPAGRSPLALRIEQQAAAARARLDPATGRMIRAVLFPEPEGTQVLVLVAHHLVVDGVSWRILLSDLEAACAALALGRTPDPQPVGTSYRAWSKLLTEQAGTALRGPELALWERILSGGDEPLGPRRLDPALDVRATAGTLRVELPPEVTGPLLGAVPAAYRAEVNDVLLAALAVAVAEWRRARRRGDVEGGTLVELEGHGREEIVDGVDLSRTVGWFTSIHPVRLDPGPQAAEGPGAAVKRIKEQLRAVPEHGIGHGMLRHLNPQAAQLLARYRRPELGFNYMGRFDVRAQALWAPVAGAGVVGTGTHPAMPLEHVLELTPATEDLADGPHLVANWTYASGILAAEEVAELAGTWFGVLRDLAGHAGAPGSGGATPSDFPLVALGQEEIEAFEASLSGAARSGAAPSGAMLADVLPLTPLQQGLLFHHVSAGDAVDVYTLQIVADLEGELDPEALRAAGQALLRRHPALRACFRFRESGEPVQLIASDAELPWQLVDLTELPEPRREAVAARLADEERARRFDLAEPPLLRFTLIRTGPQRHRFVWTSHHLLVDGWSMPILVADLLELLAGSDGSDGGSHGGSDGAVTPASHRDYYAWLAGRDRGVARDAWRRALAGLPGPTLVAPAGPSAPSLPESLHLDLGPELTAALTAASRAAGLTLNTVVQGCWAVLLGELTGLTDVVFGAVTAGRSAEVPRVESMVGMFLTTVPVRVRLHPDATLGGLLRTLQAERAELLPHEHLGLAEIHRAAGLAGEAFDTLLLFENFPLGAGPETADAGTVRVVRAEARDARHHPLSMVVLPEADRLRLRLDHLPDLLDHDEAARIADRFTALLRTAATAPGTTLARLGASIPAPVARAVPAAPGPWQPSAATAPRPPRTEREETVCAVLAEVLGLPQVAANDDFFAIGGDSIRAIQVVARAQRAGLALQVRDVFTGRTAAALAAVAVPSGAADAPGAGAPDGGPDDEPLLVLSDGELDDLASDVSEDML